MANEITVEAVKEWMTTNKEDEGVITFLAEITPEAPSITSENVLPFLETTEGKALVEPLIDKRVTRAVQTHDAKTQEANEAKVRGMIAAEMLKINPEETPEQKQIRELREEMDAVRSTSKKDTLMRQVVETVASKELPSWLADIIVNPVDTPEEGQLAAEKLRGFLSERETETTNKLMAGGFKPGGSGTGDKNKIDVSKLSVEEVIRMEEAGELDTVLVGE